MEPSLDLAEGDVDSGRLGEFTAHWDACRVSVRAYLSTLLYNKSDIEDCVQEVALIAWKKGPMGQGGGAFLGHCLASARFVGLAASRKLGKSRISFLPPDVAESLADEVMRQEEAEPFPADRILALRTCMSRLDGGQRRLLALRYSNDGRGQLDDAARSEGKSPDAFYKQLERIRKALRKCVAKRMEENEPNP